MPRLHADWLSAYIDYAGHGEAPKHFYFWSGVSAVAGALRRKVWIDEKLYKWYPNLYIVLVAPPGIVSKTTTVSIAMRLLRKVPGVKFGPSIVTWPALVSAFSEATELFQWGADFYPMSSLTLESGEFGNLLDPSDKQMVDLLVRLWDGDSLEKRTKGNGTETVENPWINLIACTTPSWIAGNFPQYMIGGGFTSRTIFVYADTKARYVAYPSQHVPHDMEQRAEALVADLTQISKLTGEYRISASAREWGDEWYLRHYSHTAKNLDPEKFGAYISRKQTMLHKVAMILSASEGDSMTITTEHLVTADAMLTELEPDLQFVFSKIGQQEMSIHAEKLITYIHSQGRVAFHDAYRYVHQHFPRMRDFEDILAGACRSGYILLKRENGTDYLSAGQPLPRSSGATSKARL